LEKYQRLPYNGTFRELGREEDPKIVGEDRLSKKWGEVGMNKGFWQLIEVERTRRHPILLLAAMVSIIIIIIIIPILDILVFILVY
jgi:hypothetical protein